MHVNPSFRVSPGLSLVAWSFFFLGEQTAVSAIADLLTARPGENIRVAPYCVNEERRPTEDIYSLSAILEHRPLAAIETQLTGSPDLICLS